MAPPEDLRRSSSCAPLVSAPSRSLRSASAFTTAPLSKPSTAGWLRTTRNPSPSPAEATWPSNCRSLCEPSSELRGTNSVMANKACEASGPPASKKRVGPAGARSASTRATLFASVHLPFSPTRRRSWASKLFASLVILTAGRACSPVGLVMSAEPATAPPLERGLDPVTLSSPPITDTSPRRSPRPARRPRNGKRSLRRLGRSWLRRLQQDVTGGVHEQAARAGAGIEVPDAPLAQVGGAALGRDQRARRRQAFLGGPLDVRDRLADGEALRAGALPGELHGNQHVEHGLLAAVGPAALLHGSNACCEHLAQRRP